ncbi:unnamed protein product [Ectocarpus sp. CCAP 1310/34]|nr:unnamed protein product [Ectocarpus sp. CCAP 1310/34]
MSETVPMDVHAVNYNADVSATPASAATSASAEHTSGTSAPAVPAVFDPSNEYCTPDMVFFWQPPSPFSQWTPSTFVVDGVVYSCAEQFFAAEKARLFKDHSALQNIMRVSNPALHKKFGRGVCGFDPSLWEHERENIVLTASYAKFSQNSELCDHLLGSGDKILAEASPYDCIWGIGLQADNPDAQYTSRWRGLNLLGNALQRSFSRVWDKLPCHLREISFNLHGPGWTPEVITQLGDVLCEYHDVFSSSPTDFGSCSLFPFKLTVPPGSAPVTSRPYRVNPPVAKQVDAILDQYLAAGLIQHSTSPYSSPLVVIPKKSGGVRITVNYRKLNKLCALSQLPIPRVDDTLDKLLKGRIYSLFDMKSSFHQITVHRDTIPLTAFVTSSGLFEWLKMPQGSSAAPGWFCKVVNEVIKNLHGVASYLDDLIVFDDNPASHVDTMRALFERLRTHNLKLTPPKATVGATEADFLGHTISPDGVRPNGAKVAALTKMPMPRDVKQLRSLLGGLSYYRKFLPNMATRIRPLTTLLKKQATFVFTLAMEQAVRILLSELANPPVLVYPDWDAVSDGSRPFRLYCDASRDGFGGTLEQEQPDGSIRPIVFISRATLDSERHWTPLDLEAGSIVWSIKRLRGYLWGTKFRIFTDHKSLEHFAKVGENNARVQRWLEFLTAYNYTLEYRKGSANGNADFLSRLPIDAAECDRSGRSRLTPDGDEEGVSFIRSCGLTPSVHRAVGVGLGGLVPTSPTSVLGGLAPSTDDFIDFRRHAIRFILLGRPSALPSYFLDHLPSARRPPLSEIRDLSNKGRLHVDDDGLVLLVRKQTTPPLSAATRPGGRAARLLNDEPIRIYVPMLMRPWIMQACHADASCHLGAARTLSMLERFYWWVGMSVCTKWWVRHCLRCQARKASHQTPRWPTLCLPLPSGPGVSVSVDYFGPLPLTPRGNTYILLFTDRFSRRADMYAVTAAEFTAEGTADVLVNQYIPLWGCPLSLLSDNGSQFCSKLSQAVYARLAIRKVATSSYHPNGNGGVERVNHTMAQMLAMVVNERQDDWDIHLPHVEFAYNNSVSAATGLAPNEVHINRLPRMPMTVFEHPYARGHQSLHRDQLEYCDLAADRQRRSYDLVREQHNLSVSRIERRNSALTDALRKVPSYAVGGWVWVYNTESTIRQGVRSGTDDKVLKAKLSFLWTGPFKILAVGPCFDAPDGCPLASKLLYLDLPSDLPGLLRPSWEREMDLQHSKTHILRYWTGSPDQHRQTNRRYRAMRIGAATREMARVQGERALPSGYSLVSRSTWDRRLANNPLPAGAFFWYKTRDGLWWLGKITGPPLQSDLYVVRFLDDPGPVKLALPDVRYSTAETAVSGSWCLQVHSGSALFKGILRNIDMSRGDIGTDSLPDHVVRAL